MEQERPPFEIGYRISVSDKRHLIVVGKNRRKGIAGTEKADRLYDRNTCAFPTMTAYQNMEIQRIQRGVPDKAVIQKLRHGRSERYREKSCP